MGRPATERQRHLQRRSRSNRSPVLEAKSAVAGAEKSPRKTIRLRDEAFDNVEAVRVFRMRNSQRSLRSTTCAEHFDRRRARSHTITRSP
jgi:hypothetical protein